MDTQKTGFKFLPFVISLGITLCIGAVAGFVTTSQINSWYVYLHKPSFNPPNWLFGPVWTLLYIMIATAAYLAWEKRSKNRDYNYARFIYISQLLFNFLWSIVFFGLHHIPGALVIIVLLFISIVINISAFYKINKTSGWLLVPYLLWVTFAGILNLFIYMLNG